MTKTTKPITAKQWTAYFNYLDILRESGTTNMFGAAPYLMAGFRIRDREQASKIVCAWMRTFNPDVSPADRVAAMLAPPAETTAA